VLIDSSIYSEESYLRYLQFGMYREVILFPVILRDNLQVYRLPETVNRLFKMR